MSINIHFTTLIPNLINDVKAMTQQSLGAAVHVNAVSVERGRSHSTCHGEGTKLHTVRDRIETYYDLVSENYLLLVFTENRFANHQGKETLEVIKILLRW